MNPETRAWAGIIAGDQVCAGDIWWTVLDRTGDTFTLKSRAGIIRTGQPVMSKHVLMFPAPEPLRADLVAEARAVALLGRELGARVVPPA